ncbi:MAG TPA: hypothetical protein VK864_03965 [Longimicrobiales bacterium]|nr:hypothetical protein [Longimicrobiales bacterium]
MIAAAPPATAGLGVGAAAQKAPPFRLPGEHFAAALLFLMTGAIGVWLIAPDLAAGLYLAPRVAAVTHLFTLGWITTSIMGALYQFLPVALDQPIRSMRLAHVTFALYAPGLALFVGGIVFGTSAVMLAGAAAFGTGVLLFAGNLGATLRRSTRRDVTWWALLWADVFLVVTLVFGLALAANLRFAYLGSARYTALGTHLHVALAGWVLLVMVGVANRLLPMFLLSHGAGEQWAKRAVAFIASGAGVLAVLHHAPPPLSRWLPAALIGAGVASFLVQARRFYTHRHRPALDPGMRLAAGGLLLLAAGLAVAGPMLVSGAPPRLATAYVLVVILGISVFVAAHYYKIVPFLVWFHRFGPLAGKGPVPRVAELYDARMANAVAALLVLGAITLTVSVALGAGRVARAGALLLLCGSAVEAVQMLMLARKTP